MEQPWELTVTAQCLWCTASGKPKEAIRERQKKMKSQNFSVLDISTILVI